MAITEATRGREPGGGPWGLAALLALAAGLAQIAGGGWRGSLRVDAGEPARMAVDLAPAADPWQEDQEGGWEGVLEAGGIQVRLRLTPMPDCD